MAIPTYNANGFQGTQPSYIIPQDSSPLWQNVANVGFEVLQRTNVAAAQEAGAVEQGAEGTGSLLKREGFLGFQKPSDVAYNDAAQRTFLLNKKNQLTTKTRELAEANKLNPDGFAQATQEFRSEFFTGIPEKLTPVFKAEFDNTIGDTLANIKGQKLGLDREKYSAAWTDTFKTKSKELRSIIEQNPNDPRVEKLTAEMGGLLASATQPTNEGFYIRPEKVVELTNGMAANRAIGLAVHDYMKADGFAGRKQLINDVVAGKAYADVKDEQLRDQMSRELRERFAVDQQEYTEARAGLSHEVARAGQALESGLGSNLNIAGLPQRMAKLGFNEAQIAESMLTLRQSQRVGDEIRINQNLALPALRDKVDEYRVWSTNPTGTDEQRLTNAKLYEVNSRLYAQMSTAIASDPYKALAMYRPNIYNKIANDPTLSPEEKIDRWNQAGQQQFGITSPPVAPPPVITATKNAFANAQNADDAIKVIGTIQQQYPTRAAAILEAAGLESEQRLAARSYLAGRQQEGALIYNASRNMANNKKGMVDYKQADVENDFGSAFGKDFFKANPSERADYFKAFEALYVEGKARGVSNPRDYAANVLKNTGVVVESGNAKMIAPVGTNADALQKTFNSIAGAPALYDLHLGDPNNPIQSSTLGDVKAAFKANEFTLARSGERFVIVDNKGQQLMRKTPTGFQPLYIDKLGKPDMPQIDSNVAQSDLFKQEAMTPPVTERVATRPNPRNGQPISRTEPVSSNDYVTQLVTQAAERKLPLDPLALQMTFAMKERAGLSAVGNFIAKNDLTPQTAEYLSQFEEFSWLKDSNMRATAMESWKNAQNRRRVNPFSGREQSPLERLHEMGTVLQARPVTPVTAQPNSEGAGKVGVFNSLRPNSGAEQ